MPHAFVDETVIRIRSGHGGDGCVSFRREKYEPHGGPDGGDGGRGGHVYVRADENRTSLLELGRNHLYRAERGEHGKGKNRTGRSGEDIEIVVPVGTLCRERESGELLQDLDEHGQRWLAAKGGKGGKGNKRFATPTHQAPRESTPGEEGEELELALELKLMADVGLLGLPNAGKSTFLSRISDARPRIASYPFTTLAPQLGIAEIDVDRRLVVADVPGLIEGAHEGVGLGIEFLRHLERTRALVHLVDPFDRDLDELVEDHRVIRNEIESYVVDLSERPIVTVFSKADLVPSDERATRKAEFESRTGVSIEWMSGATGEGLRTVLERLWVLVHGDPSSAD